VLLFSSSKQSFAFVVRRPLARAVDLALCSYVLAYHKEMTG